MDQQMPGQNVSYWKFLTNMFLEADKQRSTNISEAEVEKFQLKQLEILRETIKKMPGYDEALEQLKNEVTEKPSEAEEAKSLEAVSD